MNTATSRACPDWKRLARELLANTDTGDRDSMTLGSDDALGYSAHQKEAEWVHRNGADWESANSESAAGDDGDDQGAEWQSALKHQKKCVPCRVAAMVEEPTVLFQSLPQIELSALEIETMLERVAGVRRGRTVAGGNALHAKRGSGRPGYGRLQWVSAAAVLTVALTGALGVGYSPEVAASGLTAADEALLEASLGAQPLVEGVDVYDGEQSVLMQGRMQSASGELDFAWVVDGALEP